jgi:hypothetical protein
LEWLNFIGILTFDIHVRKPKASNEDFKTGSWIWLTYNQNVKAEYIENPDGHFKIPHPGIRF